MAVTTRYLQPLSRPSAYVSLLPFRPVASASGKGPLVSNRTVVAQAGATKSEEAKSKIEVYRQNNLYDDLALSAGIDPKLAKELADSVFSLIETKVAQGKRVMILGEPLYLPRASVGACPPLCCH